MIKALPGVAVQAKRAVQHIIEVATDAGAPNPGRFGRQIQGLANHSRFPEQFPVSGRAAFAQDRREPRQWNAPLKLSHEL